MEQSHARHLRTHVCASSGSKEGARPGKQMTSSAVQEVKDADQFSGERGLEP
jgi:hypothetical protein